MKWSALLLPLLLLPAGCKLSKDESTLSRLHEEMANKKPERPKTFPTEDQLGLPYYPGCAYVQKETTDEFGASLTGVVLSTTDTAEQAKAFYEKQMQAQAVELNPHMYRIQADRNGKRYEVSCTHLNGTTI